MQALEGDIDTVHAVFLHAGHVAHRRPCRAAASTTSPSSARPASIVTEHEIGATYAAVRPADRGNEYWRTGHFLLAVLHDERARRAGTQEQAQAWVPLDDENTMIWTVGSQAPLRRRAETIGGFKAGYMRRDPLGKNDPYGRDMPMAIQRASSSPRPTGSGRFRPSPTRTTTT